LLVNNFPSSLFFSLYLPSQPKQVSEAHSAPLVAVSFAPDASDKFATASLDCTLRVWDAADYGALCLVQVACG